ncbi:hypothetical protein A3Q56_07094 [Intoshia linei]|uniref:Uncharacterized protein n=1 Tax=Intoshia linei TaxID=1819745 RepID=A0A177AUV7_9BILA|nr:hypothetical protein A3Q56_07094 [Intoshia linei]
MNIFDVVSMLQTSWERVTPNEIQKSWKVLQIGQESNYNDDIEIDEMSANLSIDVVNRFNEFITPHDDTFPSDSESDFEIMATPPSNNLFKNEENIDLALKNVESLIVLSSKIDIHIMDSELDFLERYKKELQDKKSKYL